MPRKPFDPVYVSSSEAARMLHVTRATVSNWARQGRITGIQYGEGGIYRFLRTDIEQFLVDSRLPAASDGVDKID